MKTYFYRVSGGHSRMIQAESDEHARDVAAEDWVRRMWGWMKPSRNPEAEPQAFARSVSAWKLGRQITIVARTEPPVHGPTVT